MPTSDYAIKSIESAPFAEMSYVIWRPGRSEALVIDPGFDTDSLVTLLSREGLRLAAILNTHGHADHIAGNAAMKAAFPEAPLIIGRNEAAPAHRSRCEPQRPVRAATVEPSGRPARGRR